MTTRLVSGALGKDGYPRHLLLCHECEVVGGRPSSSIDEGQAILRGSAPLTNL